MAWLWQRKCAAGLDGVVFLRVGFCGPSARATNLRKPPCSCFDAESGGADPHHSDFPDFEEPGASEKCILPPGPTVAVSWGVHGTLGDSRGYTEGPDTSGPRVFRSGAVRAPARAGVRPKLAAGAGPGPGAGPGAGHPVPLSRRPAPGAAAP